MSEGRIQRRLAAIVAADVVGYSRLIESDEEGTRARLRSLYAELIEPRIAADGGRIVKTTGDGVLVEFPSAVDAVRNALAIQTAMADRDVHLPEDRRIRFRVGINIGDVIVEGEDIHGDGVNVAARIERLCEPGEVFVSGAVHDQAAGKIDVSFEDLGERQVKNISRPVRVYRARAGSNEASRAILVQTARTVAQKPAIAVLPFDNMSGDPEQEYFADGLTEDIITALSNSPAFPVIARNSTFSYKGTSPDVRAVGRDLGVRYVIEGSVRKGGNRLRITAQLVDAETGEHVWAETFDREIEDIFDVQDEITSHVAATIEPTLELVEAKRLATRKAASIDAWGYYQRAMSHLQAYTEDGNRLAREMAERAIELDPNYALAYVPLAYSHYRDIRLGFADDEAASEASLIAAARRAQELDPSNPKSHYAMGLAFQITGQYEFSVSELTRSLEISPYFAWSRFALGGTHVFDGEPEKGIPHLLQAFELNPRDPRNHAILGVLARAYLNNREYEEAIFWARKAIGFRSYLVEAQLIAASALGHLGRLDESKKVLDLCESLREGSTATGLIGERAFHTYETKKLVDLTASRDPLSNAHYVEGLRKAGAPD